MARTQELLVAFGKGKQTDIATANLLANVWRLNKLNTQLTTPKLTIENDAPELGKGHEFATQTFQSYWDVSFQLEKYLSSQMAAWALAFALGNVVKSGVGTPYTYTCTPLDPVTAASQLELPYFSYIEQIRPGANKIFDTMMVGNVIEDITISLTSGPGRSNSKIVVNGVGSGKFTEPSGITMPALTPETLLPGASLTLNVNGTDYVANKNILTVTLGWKNNVDLNSGFFPGCGFQTANDSTSGAIRGRMEVGTRAPTLTITARMDKNSAEFASLKSQTSGQVVIGLSNGTNHSLQMTFWKCVFQTADRTDANGLVTVSLSCVPEYDVSNGVCTAVVKTDTDGICQ